jgi:hypothetical protein
MSFSSVPVLVVALLGFLLWMVTRARTSAAISRDQARGAYWLVAALGVWCAVLTGLGLNGVNESLAASPSAPRVLWQAGVAVVIVAFALLVPALRATVAVLGDVTPWRVLIAIQAIRISAIGSVAKFLRGEIASNFPLWVGIPDFLFGTSAVLVAVLYARGRIGHGPLAAWSLIGAAIILVPTFGLIPYWMQEPGFAFIFEFPMVLAPGVAVPILVLLNLLLGWRSFAARRAALVAKNG